MPLSFLNRFFSSTAENTPSAVTTAVSILKHHRSNSRWSNLRHHLQSSGLTPSQFSQVALQIKNNPHLAFRFFTWYQENSPCAHTTVSYSTIIHILSASRLKSRAQDLIRKAIRLFESGSSSDSAPKLFETLVSTYTRCGSAPFVFDLLVNACLDLRKIDASVEIMRMLRSRGIGLQVRTCNYLVWWVCKVKGVEAGYAIYRESFRLDDEFDKKGWLKIHPNVQTFNTLMICCYQCGLTDKLEEIWIEMAKIGCAPNGNSYSALMAAYCDEGKMKDAIRLWEEMGSKGIRRDALGYNTLIGGFCRGAELDCAEELYREMLLSGIESTYITYEHLINGYCKVGDLESALMVYKDMYRRGHTAEASVVNELIRGLCDRGRASAALEILRDAMRDVSFSPRGESYGVLIKGLCGEGEVDEALKLQAEMVGKGFRPNSDVYGAFVDGYLKQGKEEMAERLRKEFESRIREEEDW